MTGIIVVFPKLENAKGIKGLLAKSGFSVQGVCTTGAQAVSLANELEAGIVVCGYKFPDMMYHELKEYLPPQFEMLLVVSKQVWEQCQEEHVMCLEMPVKAHELIQTLEMMVEASERRRRRNKRKPVQRNNEEKDIIRQAKELLMERNNLVEEEAHRYIQKCSMDSGTNMVETAQMILSMMNV